MEEVEKALVTFCENKSFKGTLYLSDMILFLKEWWDYSLEDSLALIESCIDEGYLEIRSIAQLYDLKEDKA